VNDQLKTYYIESLGCNKNTVDSEILMTLLRDRGFMRVDSPDLANLIIVNTCAFIDEAKQEAVDTILELSRYRNENVRLIATGCLPQIHAGELLKQMPEVDVVAGAANLQSIIDSLHSHQPTRDLRQSRVAADRYSQRVKRTDFLSDRGFAYLKISEGCSRKCSFCLIPSIRGSLRSRSIDEIVEEALYLEQRGVKEIILTSQDTLSYGDDLGKRYALRDLIERLLESTGNTRFRLLYLRPAETLLQHLDLFDHERIHAYFDIPVQHVSERIIRRMNREGTAGEYESVIDGIRARIPNAVLRTTVITGFPGEEEEDFQNLLEFISRVRFNHVGVFSFSPQRGTAAHALRKRIPLPIAQRRRDEILELQRRISRELMAGEIGTICDVLVEEKVANHSLYFGRSYHFAPEVDGCFLVRCSRERKPGSLVRARVTGSDDYDLSGVEIIDS
jgi:ribosomal protein S12 methylthiotransferase